MTIFARFGIKVILTSSPWVKDFSIGISGNEIFQVKLTKTELSVPPLVLTPLFYLSKNLLRSFLNL